MEEATFLPSDTSLAERKAIVRERAKSLVESLCEESTEEMILQEWLSTLGLCLLVSLEQNCDFTIADSVGEAFSLLLNAEVLQDNVGSLCDFLSSGLCLALRHASPRRGVDLLWKVNELIRLQDLLMRSYPLAYTVTHYMEKHADRIQDKMLEDIVANLSLLAYEAKGVAPQPGQPVWTSSDLPTKGNPGTSPLSLLPPEMLNAITACLGHSDICKLRLANRGFSVLLRSLILPKLRVQCTALEVNEFVADLELCEFVEDIRSLKLALDPIATDLEDLKARVLPGACVQELFRISELFTIWDDQNSEALSNLGVSINEPLHQIPQLE